MTITGNDHTMRRGDSRKFTFNVKYTDGRSLTSSTWLWQVRLNRTDAATVISKTGTLDAAAGTVTVTLVPSDTTGFAATAREVKYIHELQGTDAASNVDTFAEGILTIVSDVAHA